MSTDIPTPETDEHAIPWTEVKPDTWYVPRVHVRDLERVLYAEKIVNKIIEDALKNIEIGNHQYSPDNFATIALAEVERIRKG
jgi:hypothetical protein